MFSKVQLTPDDDRKYELRTKLTRTVFVERQIKNATPDQQDGAQSKQNGITVF